MIRDYGKIALMNLNKRRKRTFLTLIGIFIGIAAVVGLMALGQGLQNTVLSQLSLIGGDRIIIQKGGNFGPPGSSSVKEEITLHDIDLIKKVKGVDRVAYAMIESGILKFGKKTIFPIIQGVPLDENFDLMRETTLFDVSEGRFLKKGDKNKAIIGHKYYQEEIFRKTLQIGDKIKINDKEFEIVGIRRAVGNPIFDRAVIIPEDVMRDMYRMKEKVAIAHATAKPGEDLKIVAERINEAIRKDRGLDEGKENFEVSISEDIIKTFNTILLIVQGIIIGIAAISLLVGGIGIMNTMYTSVLERTNEIGIMKAIGARNSYIMIIFMVESGLLGLVGGIIGIIVGIGLSKAVEIGARFGIGPDILTANYPPFLIIGALTFSFLIGSISGLLPAIRAAKMNPVDALRYE